MKKLVFICTGNTCRSPMAKGIMDKLLREKSPSLRDQIEIETAGLMAFEGAPASDGAISVMAEVGVDLSLHEAQKVSQEMLDSADWVLTMTKGHRECLYGQYDQQREIYTLYEYVGEEKDVVDPFGGEVEIYRECRDELEGVIIRIIDMIKAEINHNNVS